MLVTTKINKLNDKVDSKIKINDSTRTKYFLYLKNFDFFFVFLNFLNQKNKMRKNK